MTNSGTLNQYLGRLLRFLIQNIHRYPFLEYLARDIIEFSERRDNELLKSPALESELTYSRAVLDLRSILQKQNSSQIIPTVFDTVHQVSGGKRLNATLAIVLVELLSVEPENSSLKSAKESWSPILQEDPSSFERIAMAHLLSSVSVQSSLYLRADTSTKTLLGFVFSRRKLYILARDMLEEAVGNIERVYGGSSSEYLTTVAELVKCYNMTQDPASGKRWAEHALSSVPPKKDEHGPTLFVRIALADAFLANAQYQDAVGILQQLLKVQGRDPSITLKVLLRLCKALRRLGEIFPSSNIVKALAEGIHVLDEVPDKLRLAFLEEVLCNLGRVDITDPLIGQTVTEACEAAVKLKPIIHDHRHNPHKDILEESFRVIDSVCRRQNLPGMCHECSTASACYFS